MENILKLVTKARLADRAPLPLDEIARTVDLATLFNHMCDLAPGLGVTDPLQTRKVNRFENRQVAERRIAALHSSCVATASADRAEKARENPGQRRLRASGSAEKLRKATLADQKKAKAAAKKARTSAEKKGAGLTTALPKELLDDVTAKGEPTTKTVRAHARHVYTGREVVTKLYVGNPKRPGSKQAEHWDALRDGMTVDEYIAAIGKAEAKNRLLFDQRRGLIRVKG